MHPFLRSTLVKVLALGIGLGAFGCNAKPSGKSDSHRPGLTVTQDEFATIRDGISSVPMAQRAMVSLKEGLRDVIEAPLNVPVPADAGGGFTHEQHKRNYQQMYNAALLFNIDGDAKYLSFVEQMLLAYADLYPTLGLHPKPKEQSPGKLFWQSLNEAVWLVYTIQAYDMVADSLDDSSRSKIELNLLRPVADFLSHGQPKTFNKIHNHGTWAAAAVGMTGYALNDPTMVKKALYGLEMDGSAGFLKQIEHLFSPDGYYAEGPYYQRYALMPFVLFAKAIDVNEPEKKIFYFNDSTLLKAISTTVQLSYNGLFFGINDAIKDKGIDTIELVHGVAIAYQITQDPTLLGVAESQAQPLLTGYGFEVLRDLSKGLAEQYEYRSMMLKDGMEGDEGALAIFRSGPEPGHQALVMKNTSQGLGHGHFDKLHWIYYDNGEEIVSDYGAARFLNIEAKYGGHYLPENNAWAKQTIAHNTLVVDQQSHFDGDWRRGQKSAPEVTFYSISPELQITNASIDDAYQGVRFSRTMAMISDDSLEFPLVVDLLKVSASKEHQFDLPLHYQGQLISHNFEYTTDADSFSPLGETNGYQFLWDRGRGEFVNGLGQLTWLNKGRFYTYSTVGSKGQQAIFAELGANDPNFNLKKQSALIHRVEGKAKHAFLSVLEQHGEYNGRAEFTVNANSQIKSLSHQQIDEVDSVFIEFKDGSTRTLLVTEKGTSKSKNSVNLNGKTIEWTGHTILLEE